MVEIHNSLELHSFFNRQIIPKLLEMLAEDAKKIMITHLRKAKIHEHTMHTYADYVDIRKENGSVVIYIDYFKMADEESESPNWTDNAWGRFTNTFDTDDNARGSMFWYDNLITFKLAQWLEGDEKPVGNWIGNQPLLTNLWFSNIAKEVNQKLPTLIPKHLRQLLGRNAI